jgi:diguanylate cyclase
VDWGKLPDLIAVGLLAWAFASVARRCRTATSENWLAGWYLIVLHFILLFFIALPGFPGQLVLACAVMTLILAAMLFMRASLPANNAKFANILVPVMTSIFGLFVCSIVFQAPNWLIYTSEALLTLTPLAITLAVPDWSSPVLRWSLTSLHLALGLVFWMVRNRPDGFDLAIDASLCMIYLGCAIHFWYHCRKPTAGALIGIAGFLLWASVFWVAPLLLAYLPSVKIEGEIWNLPKYIVAVGMILLMLEEQIEHNKHLALHDELTSLPNRRLFVDRLSGAIERARRAGTQTALLMVDLDEFKAVNDNFGHHTGDLLLQSVATLLSERIRQSDTVARTGGDEFAVILEPPTNHSEAALVSNALLELLQAPMRLGEHWVRIGASVGIAVFPDDARDLKSLCIQADMRMYEGKRGEPFDVRTPARRLPAEHPTNVSARAS